MKKAILAIAGSLLILRLPYIRFRRYPMVPVYLQINTGGNSKDLLIAEIGKDFVSSYAKDAMKQKAWKPGRKTKIKFGRSKVAELGFTEPPTTQELRTRIRQLGHALCESWDAPAIRLALKNQTHGDYFWTAMEEIVDSHGDPRLFIVSIRGVDEPWLCAGWADSNRKWDLNASVVYRITRSSRRARTRAVFFYSPH